MLARNRAPRAPIIVVWGRWASLWAERGGSTGVRGAEDGHGEGGREGRSDGEMSALIKDVREGN